MHLLVAVGLGSTFESPLLSLFELDQRLAQEAQDPSVAEWPRHGVGGALGIAVDVVEEHLRVDQMYRRRRVHL